MSKQGDIQALLDLASSQQTLLGQFLSTLAPSSDTAESVSQLPPNPPNPLHVLRDSASLLKAHATKLSLLLINKPFTATAIQKVLREVSGTCIPAMMSAVQICQPDIWGSFLHAQVVARVRTVLREMDLCYNEVVQIANGELQVLTKAIGNTQAAQEKGRDSLVSTGLVWAACDKLIELESDGIGALAVRKAEEWRDMIKDAIQELKEWEEDAEDEDDEDDDGDSDKDSIEEMFSASNSLPKDRDDLKKQLTTANDKLKKIGMLYAALIKRRLSTFTPAVSAVKANIHTLDKLLDTLKGLPETVDDLASAFYDLDTDEVEQVMQESITLARQAAELVKLSWAGKEDEFTTWVNKWLDIMK